MFHEPLTLNIINKKHIFATYACTKEKFYESFKSFSVITAKHETAQRVDSTIRHSHITGDSIVYPETTR